VSSYIAKGEVSVTTGVSWDTYMYRAMDTFARIFTHKSIAPDLNATDPQWFITAANIPSTTSYFPVVANYEAQYKKLWGLG
jgi:hypothetical protein